MKSSVVLLGFVMLMGCANYVPRKQREEISLENQINTLDYKFILPDTWHPFLDIHGEVSFRPVKYSQKRPIVQIHLCKIRSLENEKVSLSEFIENMMKNSKMTEYVQNYYYEKEKIQTVFGETYLIEESYIFNGKNSAIRSLYFQKKESIYSYTYFSTESLFNKFINDYVFIFSKLDFKE